MIKKRVLLIAPTYMNIYEDIISGLKEMGYEVQYYPDIRIEGDPFNKVGSGADKVPVDEFIAQLDARWSDLLSKDQNNCCYDYLMVIDGLSVSPLLFSKLRGVNPNIVACNYLYDRVKGVYELDRNFPYYNRIFSFDKHDCIDYNLLFLPIYWKEIEQFGGKEYDVFGFGAYDEIRFGVFKKVKRIAAKEGLSSFIRIYKHYDNVYNFTAKNIAKALIRRDHYPLSGVLSGLFTNKMLSPSLFRDMIGRSAVILDTNHPYQDGLTARFMWALGAEKKIITTNSTVKDYPFYSKEQFFIIDNNWEDLPDFLSSSFIMNENCRKVITNYRIDKWLNSILGTGAQD